MEPLANTIKQTCQRLNLGHSSLHLLLSDEEIESFLVGSRRLISESELQRFIARSALIDRINRVLEKRPEPTRIKCRALSRKRFRDGGRYFIVDNDDNLVSGNVDLVALGRELNLLKPGDEDGVLGHHGSDHLAAAAA